MGGFGAWSLEDEGTFDPTHTEICLDISTRLSTCNTAAARPSPLFVVVAGAEVVCFCVALFSWQRCVGVLFSLPTLLSTPTEWEGETPLAAQGSNNFVPSLRVARRTKNKWKKVQNCPGYAKFLMAW